MEDPQDGAGRWWDRGLPGCWIVVNAAAYVVVVVGGVALELLASATPRELASDHWWVAVVLVAVLGAGFHGLVLGPLLGFLIYGVWMPWVTAPEATAMVSRHRHRQGPHRIADPGIPD